MSRYINTYKYFAHSRVALNNNNNNNNFNNNKCNKDFQENENKTVCSSINHPSTTR